MFQFSQRRSIRARLALLASFLLHGFAVFLWLSRSPIFVKPSAVAWGRNGSSENLIYFRPDETVPQSKPVRLQLHVKQKREEPKAPQATPEAARAGAPTGSQFTGLVTGVEARPAIPLVFPDPAVFPWQLPKGLQRDVIVEITIDEQGNVTDTRLLQSLRQDVDEKVVATLHGWRFRPATVDGVAISSRQDVHFHFPA